MNKTSYNGVFRINKNVMTPLVSKKHFRCHNLKNPHLLSFSVQAIMYSTSSTGSDNKGFTTFGLILLRGHNKFKFLYLHVLALECLALFGIVALWFHYKRGSS